MPVTTLDPKTALVVIDLQKGIVQRDAAHPTGDVVARARELADAFRRRGLPVVLVHVTGGAPGRVEQSMSGPRSPDWAELVPELGRQPSDKVVMKRTWGAFTNTDLDPYLKAQGVTQVVVCGIATSAGVESTARFAHELGYNVTLATDAMTDASAERHQNSVERVFPRLGETGLTRDIVAMLDSRA